MKNVLVQVAQKYLCITACERLQNQTDKDNKGGAGEKSSFSFSSPLIIPIDKELLKNKSSIWEDPKLLANLVKDGLGKLSHNEVTDVIMMVESYDLTFQEYQHKKGTKKILDNLAADKIREFVGDDVESYAIISKDYETIKSKDPDSKEVTAKVFAMPKSLIEDLSQAFGERQLNLIKLVPTESAMLYCAQNTIYSYDRTVALVSMDYTSVRVMIAKNGIPLYCHDFNTPVDEILDVIKEDRNINLSAAVEYLRMTGYGLHDDCINPVSARKLEEITATLIDDIVRDIRLVAMSLNVQIDQLYISDFIAYMPHMTSYFVGLNLSKEVILISETFRPGNPAPEPSLQARDDFYKSGAFFFMNELMNSGNVFEDNFLYSIKPTGAKNTDLIKKLGNIGCAVMAGLILIGGGVYGFLEGRQAIDNSNVNKPEYDYAKTLIQKEEDINKAISDQTVDAALLPRTKLYSEDVINELNRQVVKKIAEFDFYSLSHNTETGVEAYQIPISGKTKDFKTFIELQNNIKADGFFEMSPSFTINENSEKAGYSFSTKLTATEKPAAEENSVEDNADSTN